MPMTKGSYPLRLEPDADEYIRARAKREGRTLSAEIHRLIRSARAAELEEQARALRSAS